MGRKPRVWLYQDRFTAKLIENDAHILENSRYIHLNPVNTKVPLCENISEYPWSSYRCFVNNQSDGLTDPKKILSNFSQNVMESYKQYVEGKRTGTD